MPAEVGIELDYDTASRVAEGLAGERRDQRAPAEAKRAGHVESGEPGFWTKPLLEFARPALERGTRVAATLTPDSFAGSRAIDFNLGLANALGDEVIHFSSPIGGGLLAGMVALAAATGPSLKATQAALKVGKGVAKIARAKRIGKAAQSILEGGFSGAMARGLLDDIPELVGAAKKAKETGNFFDYGRAFGKVALDAYFGFSLGKAALKSGRAAKAGVVPIPKRAAAVLEAEIEKSQPKDPPLGEAMRKYTEDQFKLEGEQNGLSRGEYETVRRQGPETLARNVAILRDRVDDLADLRQRRARINEDAASLKEALAGARKARAGIDARKDLSGTNADSIESLIAKIKSRVDVLPQKAKEIDARIREAGNPEGLLKATEASLIEYHRAVTEGIRLESPWRPPSSGTGRPGEPLPVKQWDTVDTWAGRGVVEEVVAVEGGVPQLRVRVKGGAGTGAPGEAPRDTILEIAGNDQSLSIVSSGGPPLSFTGMAEAPVPANRLLGAPPPGAGRGLPAAPGEASSAGVNAFPKAETSTALAGGGTLLRGSQPVTPETVTAVGRWALDNPRFTPGQLSEAFGFDVATTRRVIGRMEAEGLILGDGGPAVATSGEIMTAAELARWNNLGFQAKARLRDLIAARSEGGAAVYEMSGSVGRPAFGRSTGSVTPPQPIRMRSTQSSTAAPTRQPTRAASVSAPAVAAAMRRPAPGGVGAALSSTASPPAPPVAVTGQVPRPLTPSPVATAETSGARRPVALPPRVVQPTPVAVGAPPPGVPQPPVASAAPVVSAPPAAAPVSPVQLQPRVVLPARITTQEPPGVEARAPKSEMPIEPGPGVPEIGFPEGVRLMVKDDATAGLLRNDVVTYLGESEPGVQRFQTESGALIERIIPREQVSAAFDVAPTGAKALPRQGPEAPRKARGKRTETQAEANKRLREEVVVDVPVDESPYTDYARYGRDAIPEPEPQLFAQIPTWHAIGTRFRGKDGVVWRVTANRVAGVVSGEPTARGRSASQSAGPFSVIRLESVPSNRPDLLAKYAPYSSRETLGNAYFDRVSRRAARQLEGDADSALFRETERQEAARKKRLAKLINGEGGGRPMGGGSSGASAAPIPEGMGVEVIVGGKPEVWRKVVSKSQPAPPDVRGIYLREATAKSRAKGLNAQPLTAAEKALGAKPYRPVKLENGLWVVVNDSPIVREAPRLKQIHILERRRFDPANPELDYRNIESMSPGEFAERQSHSKAEVPKSAKALGTPGHRALSDAAAWAQGRGGIPARVRVVGEVSKEHPDGTLAKFTIEDTSKTTWAKENQQADQLLKLLPTAKWLEVESGTWRTRIAIKPYAEALKGKKSGADAGRPVKETKGSLGRGSKAMIEQVRAIEEKQRQNLRGAPPPGVKPPPAAVGALPPGVKLPPRVVRKK